MSIGGLLGQALLGGAASAADGITKRQSEQRTIDARKEESDIAYKRNLATEAIRNNYAVQRQESEQAFRKSEGEADRKNRMSAALLSAKNATPKMDPMLKARIDSLNSDISAALKSDMPDTAMIKEMTKRRDQLLGMGSGNQQVDQQEQAWQQFLEGGGLNVPGKAVEAKQNATEKQSGPSSPNPVTKSPLGGLLNTPKLSMNQGASDWKAQNAEYQQLSPQINRAKKMISMGAPLTEDDIAPVMQYLSASEREKALQLIALRKELRGQ